MNKHGVLASHLGLYTPEVLARVAANLRNDEVENNASQAARLFRLLGDRSLPVLREAAKSSDAQQSNFSRALLDAIAKKDRRALGYLNAKLSLYRIPSGAGPEPEWIEPLTEKYLEREKYP
jgi:hypothetical protein